MAIPDDTPGPLTARKLASVRRQAGARLFPDGERTLEPHDGWDTWAEGSPGTESRLVDLAADLRPHSWLRRILRRP